MTGRPETPASDKNFRSQREVRILRALPAQLAHSERLQRAFQIKQIERSTATAAPVCLTLERPAEQKRDAPSFRSIGRQKNATDFKKSHTFRTRPQVALERAEQAREKTRTKRNMIFTERIAQLDRSHRETRA